MDSVKTTNSSHLSGKIRSFTKVRWFRSSSGVAPEDNIRKTKVHQKYEDDLSSLFKDEEREDLQNKLAEEAILAKVFAALASVKAAYAQLQVSQHTCNVEGIQIADDLVIKELKRLSELKQCYLKKQSDPAPEETLLLAEIQEQKSLLKTYEISEETLEAQIKLKDSEISFLREKTEECHKENRVLKKRLSQNTGLSVFDELHISGLNPNHFSTLLKYTVKSIRSFVKLMINGMVSSGWDVDAAASAIQTNVSYTRTYHKCFAFESFVCREMFDGFQFLNFSLHKEALPNGKQRQQHFFDQFMKLKSQKPRSLLSNPKTKLFLMFCRAKYLTLIHPKMESSLFGDLSQRNLVNSGKIPDTSFYGAFSEMARRIWLLHCLGFSFDPEASIFQVRNGSRFSELYMESVTQEPFLSAGNPRVGLTVVPGFKIGKTIIQAQVYLSTS
ncbi:hypothetical protein ACHQM5_018302 [Ranunculus cassubicifolius]